MRVLLFLILSLITLFAWIIPPGKARSSKILLIYFFSFSLLFIYSVFRDGNSFLDYGSYVHALRETISLSEPSFILFVWIVNNFFSGNPLFLFGIYSLLCLAIKFSAIREISTLPFFSLLIFISDFYILQELTQMRAALATSILLLSLPSLYNKNLKKYSVLTLLAISAHLSALLMIPLWFINSKNCNKLFWISLFFFCYLFAFLQLNSVSIISLIPISSIQNKIVLYQAYQESGEYQANIFSLLFLAKSVITFFLLYKLDLILKYNRYSIILVKTMIISLCSLLIFSQNMAAGLRISEFYGIIDILLFPLLYFIFKNRILSKISITLIAFILFYIRVYSQQLILS